jgi:hypothetical protein
MERDYFNLVYISLLCHKQIHFVKKIVIITSKTSTSKDTKERLKNAEAKN